MVEVFLDHLAYSLGGQEQSAEESHRHGLLLSSLEALKDSGFAKHFICMDNEGPYDLVKTCVSQIQTHLGSPGAIIYSTCLPLNANIGSTKEFEHSRDIKHLMDFPASHLQSDFNLDRAEVIGINQQACTGMLGSIRLAKLLVRDDPKISPVLCVTADRFPKGALYEQSFNLISDGAAACLVSTQPRGFKILNSLAITNGALAQATDEEATGTYFVYAHKIILETLSKANLSIQDLAFVVPQNMNEKAWQILGRLLKIENSKIYASTRSQLGHVISGDNIINLKQLEAEGNLKSGDRLLLVMAGFGMNWQTLLLERV